ncbi:hypothetical protein [Polynucleobacter sp. MWH-UH35A]|uniref:hypothetical protein n=1 Tax=Polynucleobacter sp. MWH-UH35A TaxID=1855619 RepID=UPI001BFE3A02|nr:hypothetical protein [Polynucleobacter sp. MWH-UH35A]QWD60450.1 hypothetical protein ICV36_01790 [Polynucleobacter sp. MWH-UH35A]
MMKKLNRIVVTFLCIALISILYIFINFDINLIKNNEKSGVKRLFIKEYIHEIINLNINGNFLFFPISNINYLVLLDSNNTYAGSNFLYKYTNFHSYTGYESLTINHDLIKRNIVKNNYKDICNLIIDNKINFVIYNKNIISNKKAYPYFSFYNEGDLIFDNKSKLFNLISDKEVVKETNNFILYKINKKLENNFAYTEFNDNLIQDSCASREKRKIPYIIIGNQIKLDTLNTKNLIINVEYFKNKKVQIDPFSCNDLGIFKIDNKLILENNKNCKNIIFFLSDDISFPKYQYLEIIKICTLLFVFILIIILYNYIEND